MTVSLTSMTLFPGGQKLSGVRSIVLSVPATAQVDTGDGSLVTADSTSMFDLAGRNVVVLTAPARATLAVAGVKPGALSASRIAAVTQAAPGGP